MSILSDYTRDCAFDLARHIARRATPEEYKQHYDERERLTARFRDADEVLQYVAGRNTVDAMAELAIAIVRDSIAFDKISRAFDSPEYREACARKHEMFELFKCMDRVFDEIHAATELEP
jgi:hypothetical protein